MILHQKIQIADLEIVHIAASQPHAKKVCLLHGFGANCYDLAQLSEILDPQKKFDWYFPNAPIQVEIGPGYYGRAWFPIDMMALQVALMQKKFDFFESRNPPEFLQAAEGLRKFLKALSPNEPITLGGFSQGSMLSLEVALTQPESISSLLLFSSTLINLPSWSERLQKVPPMKYLQSHGMSDPVLPFSQAEKLHKLLDSAKWVGEFVRFHGQHEIPQEVIEKAYQFLQQ